MRSRVLCSFLTLGLCVGLSALAPAQVRVQILHASDLEGGVDAVDDAPRFAAVVDALQADAAFLGLPSLLLSSGDNFIPGPFFSAAEDPSLRGVLRTVLGNPAAREGVGRVDISIMNILGFDAAALGNHEFDAGTSVLASIIRTDIRANSMGVLSDPRWLGAQFPYLSSNLDFAGDPNLAGAATTTILPNTSFQSPLSDLTAAAAAPKIAPAAIVTRGSETFGIVGATTPLLGTISSPGGVQVANPGAGTNDMVALASVIQPTIDALTNAGVTKIILVTHLQQIALEQQLVPLLNGVDIAIAGGSDTLLADGTDRLRAGDTAAGPYPIVTADAQGRPAVILSTDGQYKYVGRLVISFDAVGDVQPVSVNAQESGAFATDDQGVQDLWGSLTTPFQPGTLGAQVQTLTDAVRQVVIAKDGNILGSTAVFLEGRRQEVRTEETNLGNLTADANLALARQLDATVQVSIKNGGGIRAPIGHVDGTTGALLPPLANPQAGKAAGEISQLDIENTLRFNNGLTLITLTRAQLKMVLEHGVAASGPGSTPGQFPQVGGVSFSFDPNRPAGDRVRTAGLLTAGGSQALFVVNGQVVGTEPVRVVALDFLANGGDGYPFSSFEAANPLFANRLNLVGVPVSRGNSGFAVPGTEQDALAEYLLSGFSLTPYTEADTPASADLRIQNLALRSDDVLGVIQPDFAIAISQDLTTCGPIRVDVVGASPGAELFNLFSFTCHYGNGPLFGIGADALGQVFYPLGTAPFHVQADSAGTYQFVLPASCSYFLHVEAVSIEVFGGGGIPVIQQVSPPAPCVRVGF